MSIGVLRRTATVSFTVTALLALPLLGASASAAPSADGAAAAPASDRRPAKVVPVARDLAIERYVALGDSYTAGPLIPWPRFDPVGCLRSTHNYPEYLSRELGLDDYTDASCSGAQTSHMTSEQSVPLGTNGPQFDALDADTDLVSVGIGGNDFGTFGNLVDTCPDFREADPTGSPCREHYTVDGVDTISANLPEIGERIATLIDGIRERSPEAEIVVVGYPRLVPPEGTCTDVIPFADGDYAWADSVERALNQEISEATTSGGAMFVDTYAASLGHDACAGDEAWINGKNHDYFGAASYHPFESYMAAAGSLAFDVVSGEAPNPARAAKAARVARTQAEASVSSQSLPPKAERAAAELGIVDGGTRTSGLCPVS